MKPKRTALVAIIVTGIAATFLAALTATPEVVTQLIVGVETVAASAVVVFVLLRIRRLQALPAARQRQLIWLCAGSAGAIVCLLPLVIGVLKR